MFEIFKALLGRASTESSLLLQARSQMLDTIKDAIAILESSTQALKTAEIPEDLALRARSIDKASNKAERRLRKILVEHIAFTQSDGASCLVMMSVGKDIERLVDECRNFTESVIMMGDQVPQSYRQHISDLAEQVGSIMHRTHQTFADNDEIRALELVESEKSFIARIHEVGDSILADEDIGVRRAVLLSRGLHSLHRLRAHLANIASTVVFPVHRIDFAKRSYIKDARRELGLATSEDDDEDKQ